MRRPPPTTKQASEPSARPAAPSAPRAGETGSGATPPPGPTAPAASPAAPAAQPSQSRAGPHRSPDAADPDAEAQRERRLLRRVRRGDPRAFETLVRMHQVRVYNIVYRMLGNREEAEDVAQDVFVTVFQNIGSFRGDSKFSTWLYRVAVNHCKNRLKYLGRRGRHRGRPLDEIAEHEIARGGGSTEPRFHAAIPRPDELASGHQLERILQQEIARLDEEHRVLVVLRDIQGLSYQEIVEVTGLNLGTIKSRLHRARLALKEALGRHLSP